MEPINSKWILNRKNWMMVVVIVLLGVGGLLWAYRYGTEIPHFDEYEKYVSVRQKMISAGWAPYHSPNADTCSEFDTRCENRPEMEACLPTGMAYCRFLWKRYGKTVAIITADEDPYIVGTETLTNESKNVSTENVSNAPERPHSPPPQVVSNDLVIQGEIASTDPMANRYSKGYNVWNKNLSNLVVKKNMQEGKLLIGFHLNDPAGYYLPFLVRIFDRNGNYLTHFRIQALYKGLDRAYKEDDYDMEFNVNLRDLRDAEIVEVGFTTP